MTDNKKTTLIVVGGIALLIWLLLRKHAATTGQDVNVPFASPNDPFYAPYYDTNPGIDDSSIMLNGGPPFVSILNVDVNADLLGYLSNKYIPMFGFVGLTAGYVPQSSMERQPTQAIAMSQQANSGVSPMAAYLYAQGLNQYGVSRTNYDAGMAQLRAMGF